MDQSSPPSLSEQVDRLRDQVARLEAALAAGSPDGQGLYAVLETVPVTVAEINAEGVFTYMSPAGIARLGYRPEELLNVLPAEKSVHPDDWPTVRERMGRLFAGEATSPTEYRMLGKSGEVFYAMILSMPMRDDQGRVVGIRSLVTDITDRRQAEQALRHSEARYRAIVQDQAEMVVRSRPDSTIVFANKACLDVLGLTEEQLIGRRFLEMLLPEDAREVGEALSSISPDHPVARVRNRVSAADGQQRWVEWTNRGIFDAQGQLVELQGVGRDVTDQRRAEQLLHVQRDLGMVLGEATELPEALRELLRAVSSLDTVHCGAVAYREGPGKGFDVLDGFGVDRDDLWPVDLRIEVGDPRYPALDRGEVMVGLHDEMNREIGQALNPALTDLRAAIVVPMAHEGVARTVLMVSSRTEDRFPPMVRSAIESIASQFTSAQSRILAEAARRELEGRYRDIVEDQTDFVGRCLPDGTTTFANPALCEFMQLSEQEMIGAPITDWLVSPDREAAMEAFASMSPSEPIVQARTGVRRADGSVRKVAWTMRGRFSQDGTLQEIQGVGRDITEQRRAEDLMLAQRDLGVALSETRDLSEAFSYLLCSVTELEGVDVGWAYLINEEDKGYHLVGHRNGPADLDEQSRHLAPDSSRARALRGGQIFQANLHEVNRRLGMPMHPGTEDLKAMLCVPVWCEGEVLAGLVVSSASLEAFDAALAGAIEALCSQFQGAFARIRAEGRLRDSEVRYRQLFDTVSVGLGVVDEDGIVREANQRLGDIFGYAPQELIGRTTEELYVQPDDRRRLRKLVSMGRALEGLEVKGRRADGTTACIRMNVIPIQWEGRQAFLGALDDVTEAKQMEHNLRRSMGMFRSLVESIPIEFWSMDLDRKYTAQNRVHRAVWGDLTGKRMADVEVPEDIRQRWSDNVDQAMDGRTIQHEYSLDRRGRDVRLMGVVAPLRVAGEIAGVLGITIDVTQRHQAERELTAERDHSRQIINASPAIICSLSPEGITRQINPAGERITGYRKEELVGRNWWTTFFPGRKGRQVAELQERFQRGDVFDYEVSLTTRSGQQRLISWNSVNRRDSQGRVIEIIGFGNDITERSRAERALRDSEQRLRAVLSNAPIMLWMVDRAMRLAFVQGQALEILGKDAAELIGRPVAEFAPIRQRQMGLVRRALNGEALSTRSTVPGAVMESRLSPLRDADGRVTGAVGVSVDVSEQALAEQIQVIQRDLAIELSAASDLAVALGRLLDAAMRIRGVEVGAVYLLNEEGDRLELVTHRNVPDTFVHHMRHRNYLEAVPGSEITDGGQPHFGSFDELPESVRTQLDLTGLHACALIPVVADGRMVASLNVASRFLREWPMSTRRALEAITSQARGVFDRIRAENRLRESEVLYRQLFEAVPVGIDVTSREGIVLACNRQLALLHGREAPAMVGEHVNCLYHDPAQRAELLRRLEQDGHVLEMEILARRADNTTFCASVSVTPIRWKGQAALLSISQDITQRRQAEQALRKSHNQLAAAREDERKYLAGELHDSVGQGLVALQLAIDAALSASQGEPEDARWVDLRRAGTICSDLVREVRHLCHGLFPPTLDSLGLASALKQLERFACSGGVQTDVVCGDSLEEARFAPNVEIAVYRIAQEALSNVVRHSQATRADVALHRQGDSLRLEVIDNGVGFDVTDESHFGLGLTTMRDRATAVGGGCEIESQPGRTRVHAEVPCGGGNDPPGRRGGGRA